jgi:hypothetical protein
MLEETIKHLKEICRKEDLNISPECLFENAVKIVISNNINKSKKENIQNYQNTKIINPEPVMKGFDKKFKADKIPLCTDKQKNLMNKLKIPYTENTTISQAKKLIESKLGKNDY